MSFLISAALSYLYREIYFLSFIPAILFLLFVFFVHIYQKTQNFIHRLQTFKTLIDRDLLRAQRKISSLARQIFEDQTENFYKDLDILGKDSLYSFLDTTITKNGNILFLKSILQTEPLSIEEIYKRQRAIQELCRSKYFSNRVLRLFNEISPNSGYTKIPLAKFSFSTSDYFEKHFVQKYFFLILTLNYILMFLFITIEKFHIISALFLLQLVFAYWNFKEKGKLKKQIQNFIEKIENKERLLCYISKKKFEQELLQNSFPLDEIEIQKLFLSIRKVSQKAKIWSSPLLSFILNLFLLWDFFIFKEFHEFEIRYKQKMTKVLGGLEVLDSILPFFVMFYHNQDSEFPHISHDVQTLKADWIAHPFLEPHVRVGNPLEAISKGKGILITGSNMSGKTTYLRTIGINALLALCGAPTLSKGFSLPPLKILSSIRNEDSLQDGISFFYAEVKKIKFILETVETSEFPCLVLIDEVLKGTNTRERVIATKKILEALQKYPTFVVVTTHDLELAKNLKKEKFILKHFEEQIQDGKMSFDYKIRDGLVTSSNALRLLYLEYPRIQFLDS